MTHSWELGEGEPLVLVGGLGCASWMYQRLALLLARKRRVYVYDHLGHGFSSDSPPQPCLNQLTDHLAAWLEVRQLGRPAVFGHSLGGEVVLDLASRYPEHVMAVVACAPTGIPKHPKVWHFLVRQILNAPHERMQLWYWGMQSYVRAGGEVMWALASEQECFDSGPILHSIYLPTLLLSGSRDVVIEPQTVEEMSFHIHFAITRQIKGGTHALTDSHPRAVARYTLDFLDYIEGKIAHMRYLEQ